MSTVTQTSSSALHLIKVLSDQEAAKANFMHSLIYEEDFIANTIKGLTNGLGYKMDQVMNYARTDYALALPSGKSTQLNSPTSAVIAEVISDDISYPLGVIVTYFKYDSYEPYYEVLDFLITDRKLDLTTGIFYKYPDLKFSEGQQLKLTNSGISPDGLNIIMTYYYWGFVANTVSADETNAVEYTTFDWRCISQHTEIIARPGVTNTVFRDRVLVVKYSKLDSLGAMLPDVYVWVYRLKDGTYPKLDDSLITTQNSEYLPVVPLRYNNQDLTGQDAIILQDDLTSINAEITIAQNNYDSAYAIDNGVAGVDDIIWVNNDGTSVPSNAIFYTADDGFEAYSYYYPNNDINSGNPIVAHQINAPPSWPLKQTLTVLQQKKDSILSYIANGNACRDTDLYKTSKVLLKKIDISIDDIAQRINENPDIAEIDHAYIIFGADLQSNTPSTAAYLNHYFAYLKDTASTTYAINSSQYGYDFLSGLNSILTEHGLTLSVQFTSIEVSYIPGKVDRGTIGNAKKNIIVYGYDAVYSDYADENNTYALVSPAGLTARLVLDLQWTPSLIRRVVVEGLQMTNFIYGLSGVTTNLYDIATDPNNHNFIIPLEYNLVQLLAKRHMTNLYSDCCLLVINTVKRTKLKWYQESWFAPVIYIIAFIVLIIVTVVSIGTMTAQYALAVEAGLEAGLTLAAAESAAAMAAMYSMAYSFALGYAMSFAAKLLIDKFGAQLGILGAIVSAVIVMVYSGDVSAIIKIGANFTLSYAQLALQTGMALLSATNEFLQTATQRVINEHDYLTNLIKEANDAIKDSTEIQTLQMEPIIDPLAFSTPKRYYSVSEEFPDEFYRRTLNLAYNTYYGVHGAVSNFVYNQLLLDKNTVRLA